MSRDCRPTGLACPPRIGSFSFQTSGMSCAFQTPFRTQRLLLEDQAIFACSPGAIAHADPHLVPDDQVHGFQAGAFQPGRNAGAEVIFIHPEQKMPAPDEHPVDFVDEGRDHRLAHLNTRAARSFWRLPSLPYFWRSRTPRYCGSKMHSEKASAVRLFRKTLPSAWFRMLVLKLCGRSSSGWTRWRSWLKTLRLLSQSAVAAFDVFPVYRRRHRLISPTGLASDKASHPCRHVKINGFPQLFVVPVGKSCVLFTPYSHMSSSYGPFGRPRLSSLLGA